MRYRVCPDDINRIRLNETDRIRSVLQNIAVLLTTRRQSVPLYRHFGLPMRFLDKPVNAAVPIMVAEVTDAVREFIPGVELIDIQAAADKNTPGKLIPTVEVEIYEEP